MVQKLHLLRRRGDFFAVHRQLKGVHVDDELVEHQLAGGLFRLDAAAPQNGLDARKDLLHLKGLGDVIVGALLEAGHLVLGFALGRQHDDGRFGLRADGAAHAPAVHAGQHHVQQHKAGMYLAEFFHALQAVEGDDDLVAFFFQIQPEKIRNVAVVLDDQYGFCHSNAPLVFLLSSTL